MAPKLSMATAQRAANNGCPFFCTGKTCNTLCYIHFVLVPASCSRSLGNQHNRHWCEIQQRLRRTRVSFVWSLFVGPLAAVQGPQSTTQTLPAAQDLKTGGKLRKPAFVFEVPIQIFDVNGDKCKLQDWLSFCQGVVVSIVAQALPQLCGKKRRNNETFPSCL